MTIQVEFDSDITSKRESLTLQEGDSMQVDGDDDRALFIEIIRADGDSERYPDSWDLKLTVNTG